VTYASEVAADNPRHWWRLNEPAGIIFDDSGASRAPAVALATPLPGASGVATDGGSVPIWSGMLAIRSGDNLVGFTSPWTIEAWVYLIGTTGASQSPFYWFTGSGGLVLGMSSALVPNLTSANGASTTAIVAPGAISEYVWHQLAGTHDGSNLRLYIDGALVTGPTVCAASTSPTAKGSMGNQQTASGQVVNAHMTEVSLYNTALSTARILAHYNAANLKAFPVTYKAPATSSDVVTIVGDLTALQADVTTILGSVRKTYT
jgi:hypothetical protein